VTSELLQSIASNLWSVFLIILFFGGSIFVHELGHFLVARRRGVHVERFSIGFGPKIVAWRGRDGVEYRLSWLPLGGYVLLPQLSDLSTLEGEPQVDVAALPPVGYLTRMLVFAAGAVFNLIFAFLLACVVWYVGQPTNAEFNTTKIGLVLPTIALPDGTAVPSPASEAGFQAGDVVRTIDGQSVASWPDLQQTLFAGGGRATDGRPKAVFGIERAGRALELTVYPRLAGDERMRQIGVVRAEELVIGAVDPGRLGATIGLQSGDRIVAFDGQPLLMRDAFVEHLTAHRESTIRLGVQRGARRLELVVPPRPGHTDLSDLGIQRQTSFTVIHPDPVSQIWDNLVMTYRVLVGLLNPWSDLGVSKLSGPVGIIGAFHSAAQADIRLVLWFTILVNVNLAVFNLLPIPVLDVGHMVFATIGRLRGRALPPNLIMTAQSVFIILIFSLILYVSFFDVRRIVRDVRAEPAEATAPATPAPPTAAPAPAPAPTRP
jgi:regulator of sigma E protease